MKKTISSLVLATAVIIGGWAVSGSTAHASEGVALPHVNWSWQGPFGTFDRASLRRGLQVYREVCSACHSMNLLAYRNLGEIGFSKAEIKAVAASVEVQDGPNDDGDMFTRPGKASDHFPPPFPNDKAARASNGGALPPDMSLMIKAFKGGPDFVHAILNGYEDTPANFHLYPGKYYNKYFPGHQISMPPPISDDAVEYADGTKATRDQISRDVVTFLTWASEPHMEARKRLGIKVLIFLVVFTGFAYALKRKIWSDVH